MEKKTDRTEAIAELKALLKPGETIYTILKHVSASGMYRAIDVYVFRNNEPRRITWSVGKAIDETYSTKHEALGVNGCGMDMGYHVVYSLSRALWPDGVPCIGDKCASNDHSNGDRDYTRHSVKHPHMHRDGGYSLRHRWM